MEDTTIHHYSAGEVLDPLEIEINSFDELYNQKIAQETIWEDHRVEFFQLFWYRGEKGSHYVERKQIKLERNSLLLISPNIPSRYSEKRNNGCMVLFTPAFFTTTTERHLFMQRSVLFQSKYVVIKSQSPEFVTLLELYFGLMKENDRDNLGKAMAIQRTWLHNLLIVIQREYLRQIRLAGAVDSDFVCKFKSLLNEHYVTEKQVGFYAGQLGMSERKLSQLVYSVYGVSAKEFVSEKILQEAIHLVKNTTMNQGEIAGQLGLDFTYFVKFFRRRTGLTPLKYRHNAHLTHQETGVHVLGDALA
ncbi:MAG: helix-turn-helix domain-containing protein [Dysgonamonadaceae bacterium]|jgi:AraC-like DNA-binding protein|nr:helix-turn-helix domain-containing protein [Dysgonamonadaceae bacterium]